MPKPANVKPKKKPDPAEVDPAQAMIDFTRRLLNVSKSELNDQRRKQTPKKRAKK